MRKYRLRALSLLLALAMLLSISTVVAASAATTATYKEQDVWTINQSGTTVTVTRLEYAYATSLSGITVNGGDSYTVSQEASSVMYDEYGNVRQAAFTVSESITADEITVDEAACDITIVVNGSSKTYTRGQLITNCATNETLTYTGKTNDRVSYNGITTQYITMNNLMSFLGVSSYTSISFKPVDWENESHTRTLTPAQAESAVLSIKGYQSSGEVTAGKADTLNALRLIPNTSGGVIDAFQSVKWVNYIEVTTDSGNGGNGSGDNGGTGGGTGGTGGGTGGTGGGSSNTDNASNTGGENTGAAAAPEAPKVVESQTVKTETKVENGKAAGSVTTEAVSKSVQDAIKAVTDSKTAGETNVVAEVKLSAKTENAGDIKAAEVSVPASALKEAASSGDIIVTVESDVSSITFDSATLAGLVGNAAEGETLTVTAEVLDNSTALNARQQEVVGDNPVISFTIAVGNTSVHEFGGEVTVTTPYTPPAAVAADDHDLLTVYYMDEDGNIKEMKDAKYDPLTGTITFKTTHFSTFFVSEWKNPFNDVAKGDWYYKAARFAYSGGLMNGTSAATFSPGGNLTRAMLVTILYRREGEPAITVANKFSDAADGQWYTDAIIWGGETGIVTGYSDGSFGTDDSITREQIAVILMRYAERKNLTTTASNELSAYTDASEISDWAQSALKWANAEKLINGRSADTLAPQGTASRAEVASILQRFIERYA